MIGLRCHENSSVGFKPTHYLSLRKRPDISSWDSSLVYLSNSQESRDCNFSVQSFKIVPECGPARIVQRYLGDGTLFNAGKVGQLVRQAFPNIELCKVTNSERKRLRCYKNLYRKDASHGPPPIFPMNDVTGTQLTGFANKNRPKGTTRNVFIKSMRRVSF